MMSFTCPGPFRAATLICGLLLLRAHDASSFVPVPSTQSAAAPCGSSISIAADCEGARPSKQRLYYAYSQDNIDPEPIPERASEIRQELEQVYGIDTRAYLEKVELVEALKQARAQYGAAAAAASASNSSPSSHVDEAQSFYEAELRRKIEKYKSLSISELKQRCENLGISTKGFVEKMDFIQALAEARAYDPEYRDVQHQISKFKYDPYDVSMKGLIDVGPDGEATEAPPPRDRYGRDEYGYNGWGREENWEGRSQRYDAARARAERVQQETENNAWHEAKARAANPPPPPPPDEFQKRYQNGSNPNKANKGQVPFTERSGRTGNGVDSGWWER